MICIRRSNFPKRISLLIQFNYFRKPIKSRDTVIEKSMLTTAADFIDQSVFMIRGFVVKQQEELSFTNIDNVNKIEELRKRLVKQ